MDISSNPTPTAQRTPISTVARIVCCIVLFICSGVFPVLLYYIGLIDPATNAGINTPTAIAIGALVVCAAFVLIYCRKPVFLTCTVACAGLMCLLSPWFGALFVVALCALLSGAALLADAKGAAHLLFILPIIAAYAVAFLLTGNLILCLLVLIPVAGAPAFSICFKKKISVIVSIGIATGAVCAALLLFVGINAVVGGMPLNAQGITDAIKAFHAELSAQLAAAVEIMLQSEDLAEQVPGMLGGQVTPETIQSFSDAVAYTTLALLPGVTIMLLWIFCFVAHRGFTAFLLKGLPKESCPAHLSEFSPSLPSALLLILCYAAMLISLLFENGEIVAYVAVNVLCALMPLLSVYGILGIIGNFKRATIKWPLIITYAIAVMFLGLGIIPMLSFFGAFGVIMQAIAKALEQKMNRSQGGQ